VRLQPTILVLVLTFLAVASRGHAQTALPPPIYGTDSPPAVTPSEKPGSTPLAVAQKPDQEVIASSTSQLPAGGNEAGSSATKTDPVHVDGSVRRAGFETRTPQAPGAGASALAVAVEGPTQTAPGEAMLCQVVVRNLGSLVVSQVRVELPLPSGARLLSVDPAPDVPGPKLAWQIGNLEAGGERRLKLDIQTPTSGEMLLNPNVSFAAAIGLRTRLDRPAFSITQTIPETVHRGDVVPIAINVTNNGTTPLSDIRINAHLPEGLHHTMGQDLACRIDQLAVGGTQRLQLEPRAALLGKYVTEVEATANGGVKTNSRAVVHIAETGLTLRMDGPDQVPVGREADLRVVLGNNSSQRTPATRVVLQVPEGLVVVAASQGATTDSARLVSWALPALEPGTSQTATLRLRPRLPGDWTVEASAVLGSTVNVNQQRTLHAEGAPGLAVELRVEEDPLEVGSETILEARVVNTGTFPAQQVHVDIRLPETVQLVDASGAAPERVEGAGVSFAALAELGPRQQAVYRCRVRGLRPGEQRVQVEVLAKGLKQSLHEEARCRVLLATRHPNGPGPSGEPSR
jgi:hypothetical protein